MGTNVQYKSLRLLSSTRNQSQKSFSFTFNDLVSFSISDSAIWCDDLLHELLMDRCQLNKSYII